MPRFPYMNFPFPFYRNSPRTPPNFYSFTSPTVINSFSNSPRGDNNNFSNNINKSDDCIDSKGQKYNRRQNLGFCTDDYIGSHKLNNNDYLFDLFGLKIYNDDVLLVSLIYFLYSEGVKDDGLFLVLILLLLS